MGFSLSIYKPLPGGGVGTPTTTIDLNPDIISMRYSTSLPGGFADMEIGLRRPNGASPEFAGLLQPMDILPFAHVTLTNGSALAWEGRVMRLTRPGGKIRSFSAIGYGLTATTDDFTQSLDIQRRSSLFILKDAITSRAPLLTPHTDPAEFVDPGTLHAKSEYDAMTPGDMLNALVSEGGINGEVWDYYVYENRRIHFKPRVIPVTPDYLIPFDERVEWSEDYTKLYGTVAVRFQNLDGSNSLVTPRASDPTFFGRFQLNRAQIIQGGQMHPNNAYVFAQNTVGVRTFPSYAVQITRERGRGMEVPGGADAPAWLVRAGDWVQVGDQDPLPIIHTEYDCIQQILTVECGDHPPTGATMTRNLLKTAGHVIHNTSPVTGARAS